MAKIMSQYGHSALEFQRQVVAALILALQEAVGAEAQVIPVECLSSRSKGDPLPDGLIKIRTPGKTLMVYVEVKTTVYPRDIRQAAWKLNHCIRSRKDPHEAIGILAAGSLSPGARQDLKSLNLASFDLGGNLYLQHDRWLINIEKPSRAPQKLARGIELFTDARESVIHALLRHSNEWLSGTELSALAETSQYTCSLVLKELALREWVESIGGGPAKRRMLTQPAKLLDAWAQHWQGRKTSQTKWYTFVEKPQHLMSELAERIDRSSVDYPWAFTGAAAANLVAPLLTSTDGAEIIVPKGYAEKMAKALDLKPASRGANVTLIEREDASLLYRYKLPGQPAFFASTYILYLELLNGRGRNKELAEHLKDRLESLWKRK